MITDIIHHWQNSVNLDEIIIIILMLQLSTIIKGSYLKVLSWNFHFIKFLELKVTEPGTKLLKVHFLRSLIQHFLEMVSPFTKIANICFQCQLLTIFGEHEVFFK